MSIIILLFIVVVVAILVAVTSKTPEQKGKAGETNVAHVADAEVQKGLYGYVLQNVYVPREDGSTSEIDVVFVSVKGVFVFESKNYAGYIFGNDQHKSWTVTLYAGKNWNGRKTIEKHHFYNPVWQNRAHINALRALISTSVPFYSVIVFSPRGELKNITYDSSKVTILKQFQLHGYLSNVRHSFPDVLSQEKVDAISKKLAQYTGADEEKRQKHIESIKGKQTSVEICPICGNQLVIRTAQRGPRKGKQFYGCSSYPKCRYIRNID